MTRTRAPKSIKTRVLIEARRRCCLCVYLNANRSPKEVQIAHIDRNPNNNDSENLVALCLEHHNQYDTIPRLSARISPAELRFYRDRLKRELEQDTDLSDRQSPEGNGFYIQIPENLIQDITYLLLLDRYPEGVWGRSLAKSVGAYGHHEDPGSITVSWWALEALAKIFGEQAVCELQSFKVFLDLRTTAAGAVGIRRNVASDWAAPTFQIIEHCRHTAVAANFYWRHGHSLPRALQCLQYVISKRTPSGAWTAVGDPLDDRADPLTTAYALRTLLDFELAGLLGNMDFASSSHFCRTYKDIGFSWLHDHLLQNDLHWIYCAKRDVPSPEVSRRIYSYTADILAILPEFRSHPGPQAEGYGAVVRKLTDLWRQRGNGLPSGPAVMESSLYTTALLTLALCRCSNYYPSLAQEFASRFLNILGQLLRTEDCSASGLSITLYLFKELHPSLTLPEAFLEKSRSLAVEAWSLYEQGGVRAVDLLLKRMPEWVTTIAKRILREPPLMS